MSTAELAIDLADVIALTRVTRTVIDRLGEEDGLALLNDLFDKGVVFRMAKWWLDENATPREAHVPARPGPSIDPTTTSWEAASTPAPTKEESR